MIKTFFGISLIFLAGAACSYPSMGEIENPPYAIIEEDVSKKSVEDFEDVIQLEVQEKFWTCPSCSYNEQYVLRAFQEERNIRDKNSLATLMGNIKSESNFIPNVCEGGARVSYKNCYKGGYGLIQWTSVGRYKALGTFCERYNCDPSSLEGQVRYMLNEAIFIRYLPEFQGEGREVAQYMVPAYYWLGWGIEGYRRQYAYDYTKKFVWA